jgi:hypothetical protein
MSLIKYKELYEDLKRQGEIAITKIHEFLKHSEEKKRKNDPLYPIEIVKSTPGEIRLIYMGITLYVRICIILDEGCGYIEWGEYYEWDEKTLHRLISSDRFTFSGSINKGFTTVEFANVLIPKNFAKIIKDCQIIL